MNWDLIVVGGGPAGMMAAGTAAKLGAKVLLLEKNDSLGKKLLITGGGRCNVTNAEFDIHTLLGRFNTATHTSAPFLYSAFSQCNVENTLEFFHERKMETKIENEKRVFPKSDSAKSVWEVLINYMREYGVMIMSNAEVKEIILSSDKKRVDSLKLKNGKLLQAKNYILATGGTSRPETGSTGDGFVWLKNLGHTIIPPTSSLVPIAIKDAWVKELQGVTLSDIKLSIFQNKEKQQIAKGRILFTHFGITGPTILNLSKDIGELLKYGDVFLEIDLLPHLDYSMLNTALQELFKTHDKKKIKNALGEIIPNALVTIVLRKAELDPETNNHSVTRESRIKLGKTLKHLEMEVKELLGSDKAIASSGGVDIREIDFRTMQSRLFSNLYIIGDLLDIDRPSGGFSLQLCWTTGFVAGKSASSKEIT